VSTLLLEFLTIYCLVMSDILSRYISGFPIGLDQNCQRESIQQLYGRVKQSVSFSIRLPSSYTGKTIPACWQLVGPGRWSVSKVTTRWEGDSLLAALALGLPFTMGWTYHVRLFMIF
jgi:hypothetical protein